MEQQAKNISGQLKKTSEKKHLKHICGRKQVQSTFCPFFFLFASFRFLAFFKYFVVKNDFRQKDISSLLQWKARCSLRCYFFFPFSPHTFQQNWLPFFTSYISSKLAASNIAFFCLLSILCFVVKNDFRQKIFFASSVKNKMLSQMLLLFFFFTSYVSPKLVAFFHVICFIKTGCFNCCLFLPFKYFVFCGKKWFSTKDIPSLLL